jgi:hypothetical protein
MKSKIKRVTGSKVIIERFEFPKQLDSGLFLPTAISNERKEVGSVLETIKFQNRGKVVAVGEDVKDINPGEIVVFDHRGAIPLMSDPTDISELTSLVTGEIQSPYFLIDGHSVIYIEDAE